MTFNHDICSICSQLYFLKGWTIIIFLRFFQHIPRNLLKIYIREMKYVYVCYQTYKWRFLRSIIQKIGYFWENNTYLYIPRKIFWKFTLDRKCFNQTSQGKTWCKEMNQFTYVKNQFGRRASAFAMFNGKALMKFLTQCTVLYLCFFPQLQFRSKFWKGELIWFRFFGVYFSTADWIFIKLL